MLAGVGRRFGSRVVVSAFDLVLRKRDRVALCGPNGSGKTTILRCAAGTVIPTEGSVLVAGHRAGTLNARRAVGVSLSQDRSFYLRLSGRENLLFFAGVRGFRRREAKLGVRKLEEELSLSSILEESRPMLYRHDPAAVVCPSTDRRSPDSAARRADQIAGHRRFETFLGGARSPS